ncbi:MAG TPA: amidase [candidate division Zixibacteria bacterium]|nr:amidase [candidate division Zixibacteria bacterium]
MSHAGGEPLYYLTIDEAQRLIQRRELSPVELTRAVLDRIAAVDGDLHAYCRLTGESALIEARRAEAEVLKGDWRGPLHGIPVAVKDQLDVEGAPAEIRGASAAAALATADATAVRKLRDAGAVLLGKLTMSSMPTEPPAPRNPWDLKRITGGSSTGAGAAVAAGLCLGALGEDTAGSIRNPASLCGIVGLKATYGRVSRRGLAPLGWSLDHCGPMTRTVEDCAHMLQAIAGYDPDDPTSADVPVPPYAAALREDVRGMVIGVPRDFIEVCRGRTDPEVLSKVEQAIADLETLGARVVEVSLPTLRYATQANAVIYYNEHYAGRREEAKIVIKSGPAARRARIYLGVLTGAADYLHAQRLRSKLRRECAEVFETVDLLALPCQTATAPTFEEVDALDTLRKHLAPEYQAPFNLAGLPAMSVPCGFSQKGLPVALQLVGKAFGEPSVFRAAFAYQQHARWHERRPPI